MIRFCLTWLIKNPLIYIHIYISDQNKHLSYFYNINIYLDCFPFLFKKETIIKKPFAFFCFLIKYSSCNEIFMNFPKIKLIFSLQNLLVKFLQALEGKHFFG